MLPSLLHFPETVAAPAAAALDAGKELVATQISSTTYQR